jgi:adhesin transport system outer membrane protein
MTVSLLSRISLVVHSLVVVSICTLSGQVSAQSQLAANNVKDAALQAIESNPDIQASWHEFRAAIQDVRVARAGYLPSKLYQQPGSGDIEPNAVYRFPHLG